MKLWLFTDEDASYGNHDRLLIAAESKKAAKAIVKKAVEDLLRQDLSDFEIREIVPATEPEGVICSEFIE